MVKSASSHRGYNIANDLLDVNIRLEISGRILLLDVSQAVCLHT